MQDTAASTSTQHQSTSEKSSSSAAPAPFRQAKDAIESDDDIRRVPEMGGMQAGPSTCVPMRLDNPQPSTGVVAHRKRGRAPADKEHKRLKRLLRNRVSAQQARERKKAYLNDLETRVKEIEHKNSELEERLSTLQNENHMLRQILKNTTMKKKGSGNSGAET